MFFSQSHPQHQPLYLLHGLLNFLNQFQERFSKESQITLLTNVLQFLTASFQFKYSYSVSKVASNDELYAENESFKSEVIALSELVIQRLIDLIASIDDSKVCCCLLIYFNLFILFIYISFVVRNPN